MFQGALHVLVDVAAVDGAFNQGRGFSSLSRQMSWLTFNFGLGQLDQGVHKRSLRLLLKHEKGKPICQPASQDRKMQKHEDA